MPNLIDQSFFVGDINIANTGTQVTLTTLNPLITKYEKEILIKVLGYSLYRVFLTETTQRMIDLKNGKEYQSNGKYYQFPGLVHDTNQSFIANYIYYKFQENTIPVVNEGGSSLVKKAVSYTTPYDNMIKAWNEMSEEISKTISFLWINKSTYTEFDYCQFSKAYQEFSRISTFF